MPPTMPFSYGDIVLVPFPFTDQTGTKKRPAVVISSAAYNRGRRDVVIMAITSQAKPSNAFGDVIVSGWQAAGLLKPSAIKPVIATVEQSLVIRGLGQLNSNDQAALRKAIAQMVG